MNCVKIPCKYCGRLITKGGAMDSHVHFKHLCEVLEEFRGNPIVQFWLAYWGDGRKLIAERSVTSV